MKSYFNLIAPYKFEWNDVFGPANLINTILVIKFGLVTSWFGLLISIACIIDDVIEVRKLNLILLHFSIAILNSYFLLTFYNFIWFFYWQMEFGMV